MSSSYPYATTHDVIRGLPSEGRSRVSILAAITRLRRVLKPRTTMATLQKWRVF